MSERHPFFRFEIVTTAKTLNQYHARWNRLLDTIPQYLPSMTWEWHQAWLTANPQFHNRLHFIFAYDQRNHLIGLVPFVEMTAHLAMVNLKVLTLAGIRDHIKTIFIATPEHQLPLLDALMHYLTKEFTQWDLIAFRRLGSNRADDIFLERIVRHMHLRYSTESPLEIPYLPIQGNWEEYWKNRRKHFRHEYRRKMRKLQQQGHVSITIEEPPLADAVFQRFVMLEDSGWKGRNQSSLARRPHLLTLYREAAYRHSPYFRLLQFELRVNDQVIAASLCPQTRDGLYVYKIAYDESWARYSPGMLLRVAEIQYAMEQGLGVYSFSGKAQPWMRHFTERKHFSRDFIIYQQSLAATLRHLGYEIARPYLKRLPYLSGLLQRLVEE